MFVENAVVHVRARVFPFWLSPWPFLFAKAGLSLSGRGVVRGGRVFLAIFGESFACRSCVGWNSVVL